MKDINEESKNYNTLLNMVSIAVGSLKDIDFAKDLLKKAMKNKLITDKEYSRLFMEIEGEKSKSLSKFKFKLKG